MPALMDLTGLVVGRLTVIGRADTRRAPGGQTKRFYVVRCECGVEKEVSSSRLRAGTKSCGCLIREVSRGRMIRHGGACRSGHTTEYSSWRGMKERCTNANHSEFRNYGGRGIGVCDEWRKSFAAFLAHMGPKPSPDHTLDRIDNEGNYEPGNCRWATRAQQASNKRPRTPKGAK